MIKKLIKGTSYIALSNILGKVFALFTLSLIARNLGPNAFGEMAVILSLASIYSTFAATCFPQSLLWRMNDPSKSLSRKVIFSTSLLSTFLTLVLTALLIYWLTNNFLIILVVIIADSIYYLFVNLHLSQTNYKYVSRLNILRSISKLILVVLIVYSDKEGLELNQYVAVLVYPASMILSVILMETYHKSIYSFFNGNFSKSEFFTMSRYGLPLTLTSLVIALSNRIDILFLDFFQNSEDTGNYFASKFLIIPISLLTSSAYGLLISMQSRNEISNKSFKDFSLLFICITLLLALMFGFFGPQIIQIIYGNDYVIEWQTTALIITAGLLISMKSLISTNLLSRGKSKFVFFSNTIGILFGVVFYYFLVPSHGVLGAASSFTIVSFTSLISVVYFFMRLD